MTEDSHNDAGLVYVLSGSLELSQCASQAAGSEGTTHARQDTLYHAQQQQQHFVGHSHSRGQQQQQQQQEERTLYTAYRVRFVAPL